jgi:hypothetical protein
LSLQRCASGDADVTEYRIDVVDAHGNFIRSVQIDCTDDKAAIESAKQFIHGHDIELWQRNRLLTRFDHKLRDTTGWDR